MRYFTLVSIILLPFLCLAGCSSQNTGLVNIAAEENSLFISTTGSGRNVKIVEMKPYHKTYTSQQNLPAVWQGKLENTTIEIPRFDDQRDRLYSKFQTVDAKSLEPIGHTRWVTDFSRLNVPATDFGWDINYKKGISLVSDVSDAKELGVKHATENLVLAWMFDWSGQSKEYWSVDGQNIPINTEYFQQLDLFIKSRTDAGIAVTAVVCNMQTPNESLSTVLVHPLTDVNDSPLKYCAINLANEQGYRYYRAAIEYLANRYSDPNSTHGMISGYIVGNEIQNHWMWNYMGRLDADTLIAEYMPALRVTSLAVNKFNKNIRVYTSMDYTWHMCWSTPDMSMPGDEFLEKVNASSKAEGDFPWNLAFHPYPEDLFNPAFWNDRLAIFAFDTPKITFKNIEVLNAYLEKPHMKYEGKTRRVVFSEQGFNTPDTPEGETIQAAAYALAYYKAINLPCLDAFNLYQQRDGKTDFGLKLGLKTWDDPPRNKRIYEVFKYAETPQWREAFEFAKPIIGIDDWNEVVCTDYSRFNENHWPKPVDEKNLVYNFTEKYTDAKVENSDWMHDFYISEDGLFRQSIYHHPKETGLGSATFIIKLPIPPKNKKLIFKFETAILKQSEDGVIFSVLVNDEQIFSEKQIDMSPKEHTVDVTSYAGRQVAWTFQIDKIETTVNDWAQWVTPKIVTE